VTLALLRLFLLCLGATALVTGMVGLRPSAPAPQTSQRVEGSDGNAHGNDEDGVGALAALAHERTPFRVGLRVPTTRYGAVGAPTPVAVPGPKPVLVLTGILWGRDPLAIVEGIPGQEGATVLGAGTAVGAVRVAQIGPSRVVIRGLDTTWVLTVRTPWH
jgi:hypothetical protein